MEQNIAEPEVPSPEPPSLVVYFIFPLFNARIYNYIIQDEPTPPPQQYRPSGLPVRNACLPKRYRDLLPAPPPPVETQIPEDDNTPEAPPDNEVGLPPPPLAYTTEPNSHNVYRVYESGAPTFTPDYSFRINSVADSPNFIPINQASRATWSSPFGTGNHDIADVETLAQLPFANISICCLMMWFYNGSNTKSLTDLNVLVHNVLLSKDFKLEDLSMFDAAKEAKMLDNYKATPTSNHLNPKDGWIKSSVPISLPCEKVSYPSEEDAPVYNVQGLYHRKPLNVIKAAFLESAAEDFHITPYKEYWQPQPNFPRQRIYSELYNTDAFIDEHERIRAQPRPECQLEIVVAAIMLWSDLTHLTNFGNATLWPIYLYLGNLSKYSRAKPTTFAAHHLAYIPKVMITIPFFSVHQETLK